MDGTYGSLIQKIKALQYVDQQVSNVGWHLICATCNILSNYKHYVTNMIFPSHTAPLLLWCSLFEVTLALCFDVCFLSVTDIQRGHPSNIQNHLNEKR